MHQHIRSNITRLRKTQHISQEELADRIGMSTRNLQRIENGATKTLDAVILWTIARALDVDITQLFEQPFMSNDAGCRSKVVADRSGTGMLQDFGNPFVNQLEQFVKQQQALFESLTEILRAMGAHKN